MWRLDAPIQPYAWGSRSAIASMQGRSVPTTEPEAELWMGAHPRAPARLRDGAGTSLLDAIEAQPDMMLGSAVRERFGPRLPFLLKVLAAAEPLSLQAHPDEARAREGWAREEAAGIDRGAPHRNYRDPHAKPELVCAVSPFSTLCGFAPVERSRAWIEQLGVAPLRRLAEPLWSSPPSEGLAQTLRAVLTLPDPAAVVDAVVRACADVPEDEEAARSFRWTVRLAEHYPGDPGVIVSLLLRQIDLRPGEALFLGPGLLHCYLEGTAVEIMGSSDNVLRGGLTPKHVDVSELLEVLRFDAEPVEVVRARSVSAVESVYDAPTPAFTLSRLELSAGASIELSASGPEVLLCAVGEVSLGPDQGVSLPPGTSAFVPGSRGSYVLRADVDARVFRARVGTRA